MSGSSNLYGPSVQVMSMSSGSRVRLLGTIAMSSNPYARRPDLPIPISTSTRDLLGESEESRLLRGAFSRLHQAALRSRFSAPHGPDRWLLPVIGASAAGEVREEAGEDARARTPHRLADELVELHRSL